jgi:hypothetical protein
VIPASGRRASPAEPRGRPPRPGRGSGRGPARRRSRRRPGLLPRAGARVSSCRSSPRPGATRSRCAAGHPDRGSRRGQESRSGRSAGSRCRAVTAAPAAPPAPRLAPALPRSAELRHPSVPGGTPQQPTRPEKAPPSHNYRTDVLVVQGAIRGIAGEPLLHSAPVGVPRAALPWGCSSAGRAPRSHRGGQGFESPHLHHLSTVP